MTLLQRLEVFGVKMSPDVKIDVLALASSPLACESKTFWHNVLATFLCSVAAAKLTQMTNPALLSDLHPDLQGCTTVGTCKYYFIFNAQGSIRREQGGERNVEEGKVYE